RRVLARLQDHARPHRQGARLAADGAARIRLRGRSRLALYRLAPDGGAQDRGDREGAPARAPPAQIFRPAPAPRQTHDMHRALRHQSGSAGARHAGLMQESGNHLPARSLPLTKSKISPPKVPLANTGHLYGENKPMIKHGAAVSENVRRYRTIASLYR